MSRAAMDALMAIFGYGPGVVITEQEYADAERRRGSRRTRPTVWPAKQDPPPPGRRVRKKDRRA